MAPWNGSMDFAGKLVDAATSGEACTTETAEADRIFFYEMDQNIGMDCVEPVSSGRYGKKIRKT